MDATIAQLLAFCQADPVFFEQPSRMPDHDTLFAAAGREPPDGWRRGEQELWVVLRPPGVELPEQGWKIHVSATPDHAERVCDLVLDFCLANGLPVKFLRSGAAMRLLNSKYAERGGSGKLLTLYPLGDAALAEVLPELESLLRGFDGPYVLSDLRYGEAPVYVRYGAFKPMTYVSAAGETVYAIRTPDGDLVPDDRSPAFTVPEWVSVPEVLRESLARRGQGGAEDFPYRIERPLHYSNGGGVYLARDKESGGYVVLSEARPHAGLDRDGVDAVTRLARERDVLRRLDGLDCVPRVLDHLVIWEHHFLVEEYIEGTTLLEEVFARFPLAGPDPTPEARAAYTRWAMDVLAKVDHALMAVHSRGVRFTDLHPGNVIVRPDGRVALIDFEIACDLADPHRPGLAAPGFAAPAGLTGRAADHYVMNCLRQWVFLPIAPLQDRDPVKRSSLTDVITENFPVPAGFGPRLIRHFGLDPGVDEPAGLFAGPDWPTIKDSLVAGLLAGATPERRDRLFPGDPRQFVSGGATVAYGAAGVLWALRQAGAPVPEEHVDWLVTAVRGTPQARPGLLDGLHGVAVVLDELGRHDDAREVLERANAAEPRCAVPGIHGGLAGAGLARLHFGDPAGAAALGERLAANLDGCEKNGLQHGLTGVAHFFLRLRESTGEERYLDLALEALRREVARGQDLPDGTFQLLENNSYHAYLGTGSSGLALVLSQYLARREEPGFAEVIAGARRACSAPFIRHPFLFMGRAGTIAALHHLGPEENRHEIRDHVRRLAWHALSHRGHLAFPGNQLLRLSMDLATGAAGVLVALGVAFDRNASIIPALDLRSPAVEGAGRR
ncbi:class III lanthionine synthetase LanKC [Nonomuraea rhizosphaerae]|uniref:class III lanthionine synthetase LanKC n=1 Tax=Nonomuraea rhizosphaerae TaxID=2665663 RepID=UPI001C5D5743|nr:class III lanthionine synthetase LanKC [Nonomuraea rhizosphaerae]